MTAFRAYIEPIFLYNCEIWTITSSQAETTINPFQQCLLRTYVLNVEWPNTARNEEVYRRTKAIEWSTTIQKRRLQWFGSVIRRDNLTTARRALNYAIAPIPEIPWKTSINLAEYYRIPHQKNNLHCSRHSNMGNHNDSN